MFLLFCIPIFTIGAAMTALYSITMKDAGGFAPSYFLAFVKGFIANFKKATLAFVLQAFLAFVLLFNIIFWYNINSMFSLAIAIILTVGFMFLVISFIYAYPLLAKFENTLKQTLKNSIFIAFQNKRFTLLLLCLYVFMVFLIYSITIVSIFFTLFGFAFFAYCFSFIFNKIFALYEA